jgi:hypothetical protein
MVEGGRAAVVGSAPESGRGVAVARGAGCPARCDRSPTEPDDRHGRRRPRRGGSVGLVETLPGARLARRPTHSRTRRRRRRWLNGMMTRHGRRRWAAALGAASLESARARAPLHTPTAAAPGRRCAVPAPRSRIGLHRSPAGGAPVRRRRRGDCRRGGQAGRARAPRDGRGRRPAPAFDVALLSARRQRLARAPRAGCGRAPAPCAPRAPSRPLPTPADLHHPHHQVTHIPSSCCGATWRPRRPPSARCARGEGAAAGAAGRRARIARPSAPGSP